VKTPDKPNHGDPLEEQSFRNLVEWFRPGLTRVLAGERATKVFPSSSRRRKLLRRGVFLKQYGRSGMEITVTPEAKRLLEGRGVC